MQPAMEHPADDIERLIDVNQIADRLGVTVNTVHRMVREDKFITPLHLGRLTRWRVADFNAWVTSQAEGPKRGRKR